MPKDTTSRTRKSAARLREEDKSRVRRYIDQKRAWDEEKTEIVSGRSRISLVLSEHKRATILNPRRLDNFIRKVFSSIPDLAGPEVRMGAQSATTKLLSIPYTTGDYHSEMVAVDSGLSEKELTFDCSFIEHADKKKPLTKKEFTTNIYHCRHCTFYLKLLGLPLTRPSLKLHVKGYEGIYVLPPDIYNDRFLRCRIAIACGGEDLHESSMLMAARLSTRKEKGDIAKVARLVAGFMTQSEMASESECTNYKDLRRMFLRDFWHQINQAIKDYEH